MKEYRPIDAVYDDIYDFDDVKYDIHLGIVRPREVYHTERIHLQLDCQNITGDNVRIPDTRYDTYHLPSIVHDNVHLPHIPGSKACEKIPKARPILDNGSGVVLKNKVVNLDVDRKPYIPKHAQKMPEYVNISSSLTKSVRLPHIDDSTRELHAQELVAHDEMYRSLMAGVPDKRLLERSPQVIEYERRNNVKRLLSRQQMPQTCVSKDHPAGDNALRVGQRFDEMCSHDANKHRNPHRLPDIHQESLQEYVKQKHQPLPPKAPKPENDALSRRRRKKRRTSTHVVKENQHVHHMSRSQVAQAEIDYEKAVNEALRVQMGFDQPRKEIADKRKAGGSVYDTKAFCPTPVTALNQNMPCISTPSHTHAVVVPSAEPDRSSSNGDVAKRKPGVKPRDKRENGVASTIDVGRMPEKIRKEMKKYFA